MRKNKEKERQNKNKISSLIFILTLVIISFLFLIFFVLISSLIKFLPKEGLINFNEEIQNVFRISKNKFTIEKEECINETYQIGYSCGFSYKFNDLNDRMTINFTLKPKPLDYNSLLKAEKECRKIKQEAYINSMSLEYPDTLKTWVNPFYETEQICEKKEVEEIEYLGTENKSVEVCNCGFIICYSNGECGGQFAGIGGFDRETPVDKCYQKLEEIKNENSKDNTIVSFSGLCNNNHFKDILIEVNQTISKKDLTKEWIDENCDCLDICEDLSCSNRDKCKYYKCFEDYFIEVN